eukprot:tig00000381_g24523.t1
MPPRKRTSKLKKGAADDDDDGEVEEKKSTKTKSSRAKSTKTAKSTKSANAAKSSKESASEEEEPPKKKAAHAMAKSQEAATVTDRDGYKYSDPEIVAAFAIKDAALQCAKMATKGLDSDLLKRLEDEYDALPEGRKQQPAPKLRKVMQLLRAGKDQEAKGLLKEIGDEIVATDVQELLEIGNDILDIVF